MKPLAPRLRHCITIQRKATTRGPSGEVIETWEDFAANVAAEIVPNSGREFVAAQAMQAQVDTRITIRWRDGVEPTMRVMHGAALYNIRAVLPDPTLRRHITLMCETGVNNG